jgi:hypothetical protein
MISATEAAPYYFRYIERVPPGDIVHTLEQQSQTVPAFLSQVSEEKSLRRYAPDKWSMREVLSHVNDAERVFLSRAFWFARNFETPLPSFDEKISVAATRAHELSWHVHSEEFEAIRRSTIIFFRALPPDAWTKQGIASDMPFTVRALAHIIAGHAIHHLDVLHRRYLPG